MNFNEKIMNLISSGTRHNVVISSELENTFNLHKLNMGQRINVTGYVRSRPIESSIEMDNKLSIVANYIELGAETNYPDMCLVMMGGRISSPVFKKPNFIEFSLEICYSKK